jgi:hypothetical protein
MLDKEFLDSSEDLDYSLEVPNQNREEMAKRSSPDLKRNYLGWLLQRSGMCGQSQNVYPKNADQTHLLNELVAPVREGKGAGEDNFWAIFLKMLFGISGIGNEESSKKT